MTFKSYLPSLSVLCYFGSVCVCVCVCVLTSEVIQSCFFPASPFIHSLFSSWFLPPPGGFRRWLSALFFHFHRWTSRLRCMFIVTGLCATPSPTRFVSDEIGTFHLLQSSVLWCFIIIFCVDVENDYAFLHLFQRNILEESSGLYFKTSIKPDS
jgi:hypothetical protein